MSVMDAFTKTLIIPALERDFKEGALYDARSEQIVLGYTLWKVQDLKEIKVHRNDDTNYSINASDTLSKKLGGVNISASVVLSLVSELIDLRGTMETAMQTKNTEGEFSVQVRWFFKTGYKEMDMDQLTNIRYRDVARTGHNNTATHFVIKIQYGAGAIFTFTKQFQSGEDETKVKGEIVNCGEQIESALNGNFEGNYQNLASHSKIKCEFKSIGLSLSEALPTTFDEAIRFAGSFARTAQQSFARHGGEALGVPCTVWLHPLVSLKGCADAPKLYWDFTPDQASNWLKFFKNCDTLELEMSRLKYTFEFIIKLYVMIYYGLVLGTILTSEIFTGDRPFFSFLYIFCVIIFYIFGATQIFEKTYQIRDVLYRIIELVTQLRSESKKKLREMLVEIRSGTKTFEYFQQQTNFFASRLDRLRDIVAGLKLDILCSDSENSMQAIEEYECS